MPRKAKSASTPDQSDAVESALAATAGKGSANVDAAASGVNERIRLLIRLSKEQGYLTWDDINEALPESVENQDEFDNIISILQNLEIEILEPDQVDDYKQRQEEAEEELEVKYGSDPLEIGFNVTYLLDALGALPGEDVRVLLSDANSSCLIEDGASGHCKYVVMPMRL